MVSICMLNNQRVLPSTTILLGYIPHMRSLRLPIAAKLQNMQNAVSMQQNSCTLQIPAIDITLTYVV